MTEPCARQRNMMRTLGVRGGRATQSLTMIDLTRVKDMEPQEQPVWRNLPFANSLVSGPAWVWTKCFKRERDDKLIGSFLVPGLAPGWSQGSRGKPQYQVQRIWVSPVGPLACLWGV